MEKYNLIFIDDSMTDGYMDAFVKTLAKEDPCAEPHIFINPEEGFDFIMANLNKRMIVMLDYRFEGNKINGLDILLKIREKTSLLYIILMSVNNILDIMTPNNIVELMNQDYVYFFNRNRDALDVIPLLTAIKKQWNSRFDCLLENWIVNQPEDKTKKILVFGKNAYSWEELLTELRLQSEVGKSFEKMINQFYISELNRGNNG